MTDEELDQWIAGGLAAELNAMDAGFDVEAGLDDVYSRAGAERSIGGSPEQP